MDVAEITRCFHHLNNEQAQVIVDLVEGKIEIDPYDVPAQFKGTRQWAQSCYNPPLQQELIHSAINDVLGGFGVEGIQHPEDSMKWIADYVNMGDTYASTVVYDRETDEFILTSFGDWLEAWEAEFCAENEEE